VLQLRYALEGDFTRIGVRCSIEVDAEMLAVAAASLASAGVCPLTEDPVFSAGTVQSCLSLMSSCGMYDFSGEFAGRVPRSGTTGAVSGPRARTTVRSGKRSLTGCRGGTP
jgi:glutaminase